MPLLLVLQLEDRAVAIVRPPRPPLSRPLAPCVLRGQRHFDVLVVGDEPAGVMTALELGRRLPALAGIRRPRIALITEADTRQGLGGSIARAGLAYLDRNQVPPDMWRLVPPLAPSSELYERFLRLTGVREIAADPRRVSRAFGRALRQARVTVLSRAKLGAVALEGRRICSIDAGPHGLLGADLFIDASLGGQLAHHAAMPFSRGLGSQGLSRESLALGWIFELEGLTVADLQGLEERITGRLLDRRDREAQHWLSLWPQYRHNRRRLLGDLLDERGRPALSYTSTSDSADQQSPALAIAFHGQELLQPVLQRNTGRLDAANIAVLNHRLSFNALLFYNDAEQNRAVIAAGARPLGWMLPYAKAVERFFRRNGATRVRWMPELYVRSADQIARPVEVLSDRVMAAGGVPRREALGTFTYLLDFRGGLVELIPPARPTFNFGYRHTLPRDVDNLAVLGPSAGFGGLGEGAGRIIELNISVGQGLAIASALALSSHSALAAVNPLQVAALMPPGFQPYGRSSRATAFQLLLLRLQYVLDPWISRGEGTIWRAPRRR